MGSVNQERTEEAIWSKMAGFIPENSMLRLSSLRARLLILIVLAMLPAVLFIFFLAAREQAALLKRMESDAQHVANLASREHSQQIHGAKELLLWLGAKLSRDEPELELLTDSNLLRALLAGHPQLGNVGLLSPDGEILASAYPLPDAATMAGNPAFLAALNSTGVVTGTYIVSPIFKRPTVNHAYALRNALGQVTSVLFCGLDLEWLGEIVNEVDYPGPFSMLIADKGGRVLAYVNSSNIGRVDAGQLFVPDIPELATSRSGKLVHITGVDLSRYFVASRLHGDPNLYVAVSLPFEQVMGESKSVFYRTLLILALLTVFTMAAVYFATEIAVLRSLHTLARTVRNFGAGDLSARVPATKDYGELASLARTFNNMADSLATRHREALESEARLRALSERMRQVRETEAARISRELHDEIGQLLTSLKFELARLPKHCAEAGNGGTCADSLRDSVEGMNQQIASALDFVRQVASDLRPSVLDKLGLAAALEWLGNELESRTGLVVRVSVDTMEETLSEQVSVSLFRIAQEALTNVVRHADARIAQLHLSSKSDNIVLEVRDDGKGMVAGVSEGGDSLGILGMRERVALIDGQLSIESEPGQGTCLLVTVPLANKQDSPYENTPGG